MSLFDRLVNEAIQNQKDLAPLRMVVEKELLHHDILATLNDAGLLQQLTFMGGTCLRACYGSNRLSEDLDFTGGLYFNRETLAEMASVLVEKLMKKYSLKVEVSEPIREEGNVDTWKIKVQTRPQEKNIPTQRINIDVCSIPSYQARPMMLINPYGVDMGTGGLILQAESLEEIYIDKMLAFAFRPNRLKARDLWDISWLSRKGVQPAFAFIANKVKDHQRSYNEFLHLFDERVKMMRDDLKIQKDFRTEMNRFLAPEIARQTVNQSVFWDYLSGLMIDLRKEFAQAERSRES
jgi:predicted nucleotidyltransferase component of viral defense system